MLLADAGAEVIKVERPIQGDPTRQWGPPFIQGESLYFASFNRGKKSVVLDLHQPGDRARAQRLALAADVVVENFRPGWMSQAGLDAGTLCAANPRLIYCEIKGYRRDGAMARRPAVEVTLEAQSGLMDITGSRERPEPVRQGVAAIDMMTGVLAVAGIFSALYRREQTGRGDRVAVSLEETAGLMMTHPWLMYVVAGAEYPRSGSAHPSIAPYEAFATADRPIIIGAIDDGQFRRLAEALEEPLWAEREAWRTNAARVKDRAALKEALEQKLRTHPASYWETVLTPLGLLAAEVQSVAEAARRWHEGASPKLTATHARLGDLAWPTSPGRAEGGPVLPPPLLDEHREDVRPLWQNSADRSDL